MARIKINDIGIERELTDQELEKVFGGYFQLPSGWRPFVLPYQPKVHFRIASPVVPGGGTWGGPCPEPC